MQTLKEYYNDNFLFLIVGKSGTGKTTLVNRMKDLGDSIESYTTRPPRCEGEQGHIFVSPQKMNQIIANNNIIGYTVFDDNRYCATEDQAEHNAFYIIDPDGIEFLEERYGGDKYIAIIELQASLYTRFKRLYLRDGLKGAIRRLWNDRNKFNLDDPYNVHYYPRYKLNVDGNIDTVERNFRRLFKIITDADKREKC